MSLQQFRAEDGLERWSKPMDPILLVLAFVFLVSVLLPTVTPLTPSQISLLSVLNGVVWGVFAVDYVARLYLAPDRKHWFLSHPFNLLIVILPALRIFVIVRVIAISLNELGRARQTRSMPVLIGVAGVLILILVTAAAMAFNAEKKATDPTIDSFGDGLWWAVTTVATVGYGDLTPTTMNGRIIAAALMIIGVGLFGIVTAVMSSWFLGARMDKQHDSEEDRIETLERELLSRLEETQKTINEIKAQLNRDATHN